MVTTRNRATLQEVAQHASVSLATASRVFTNTAHVSDEIRQRVLAAANELGYHAAPTRAANLLGQQGIALLIPDILNPYFTEIVRGVQDEADFTRFLPILLDTAEDPQLEKQYLRMLAAQPVAGIIVCGSRVATQDLVLLQTQLNAPMVLINACLGQPNVCCIVVELAQATYRATRHLLDLGHTRIGFLPGPSASETSRARRSGVERALREAGLALKEEHCPVSFPNIDGGFQAMSALLAQPQAERPTGIMCYNDLMALGVLHAARINHVRVPDDISVIGIDNISMAEHSNPPLTTIAPPKHRLGRMAMQMLRQMIEGHPLPEEGYAYIECPLIVRESTAHAPEG